MTKTLVKMVVFARVFDLLPKLDVEGSSPFARFRIESRPCGFRRADFPSSARAVDRARAFRYSLIVLVSSAVGEICSGAGNLSIFSAAVRIAVASADSSQSHLDVVPPPP
jgi:hypothetical protein